MRVTIQATTLDMLRAHTRPNHDLQGAQLLGDGRYEIELETEMHDQLIAIDPDLDRAITMLCSGRLGHA